MANAEDSGALVPGLHKRTRRATHPLTAFGRLLADLRGAKSVQQVVNTMAGFPVDPIGTSQPTIAEYESGKVWSPDACVLWGLARAYGVSNEGLLAVLCRNRQDEHLTLRDAERIMEAHYVGPSPQLARASLTAASHKLSAVAAELLDIATVGGPGKSARPRQQVAATRAVPSRQPRRDRTDD